MLLDGVAAGPAKSSLVSYVIVLMVGAPAGLVEVEVEVTLLDGLKPPEVKLESEAMEPVCSICRLPGRHASEP